MIRRANLRMLAAAVFAVLLPAMAWAQSATPKLQYRWPLHGLAAGATPAPPSTVTPPDDGVCSGGQTFGTPGTYSFPVPLVTCRGITNPQLDVVITINGAAGYGSRYAGSGSQVVVTYTNLVAGGTVTATVGQGGRNAPAGGDPSYVTVTNGGKWSDYFVAAGAGGGGWQGGVSPDGQSATFLTAPGGTGSIALSDAITSGKGKPATIYNSTYGYMSNGAGGQNTASSGISPQAHVSSVAGGAHNAVQDGPGGNGSVTITWTLGSRYSTL